MIYIFIYILELNVINIIFRIIDPARKMSTIRKGRSLIISHLREHLRFLTLLEVGTCRFRAEKWTKSRISASVHSAETRAKVPKMRLLLLSLLNG